MDIAEQIRVAAVGLGNGCRDDLAEAIISKGWALDVVPDVGELASLAASEAYHLTITVCKDPYELPRQPVRTLMSLQADVSAVFLIPRGCETAECAPLVGITSDQIYRLNSPTAELMEAFQNELQSIFSNQPRYRIVCIDDDAEFLDSLKALLCVRLKRALPRFALNLEFLVNPQEALDEIKIVDAERPAVIISDQIMPQLEGVELLKQAKGFWPDVRCVLLTGHAALDSAVTAINEQVLDKYFFKPIEDPVDFINNIRHLVLEHHLHTKTARQRDRLMSQFEYIRTISAAKSIDKALMVTVNYLREQMHPRQTVIALAEDGGCTVRAGFGLPENLPIGADVGQYSILKDVLQHRRSIVTCEKNTLTSDVATEAIDFSSLIALPMIWGDVVVGLILVADPVEKATFTREEKLLLNFVVDVAAMTVSGFEDRRALEDVYLGTMATLVETVEAKDSYTRGHTDRVTELAVALAKELRINGEQLKNITRAATLHDIGKIALPDSIISKPGPLDAEERAAVQEHSAMADKILQHLRFLDSVRMIARAHHERYDGTGYPDDLMGEEIPFGARIIAIVDSYDAMTSNRPYRKAMSPCDALAEIERNAGKQFDPTLVAAFLEMMKRREHTQAVTAGKVESVT